MSIGVVSGYKRLHIDIQINVIHFKTWNFTVRVYEKLNWTRANGRAKCRIRSNSSCFEKHADGYMTILLFCRYRSGSFAFH